VSGDLGFPGYGSPGLPVVAIQFSLTPYGPWVTVAPNVPAYWDGYGDGFTTTVPSFLAGYWRAHYNGAPNFQSATTPIVHVATG
jgi:hypothetical protein